MLKDLNLTEGQFMLLYSLYSWPNVILCFFGGFLIDKLFGVRLGAIIFSGFVLVGQVCVLINYMGSSSVLVLIGSHSLCNSFVVNQFLFFTPNGENSLSPRSNESNIVEKKFFFVYLLLAKYTPKSPMSGKNGSQKQEWRYPTVCVGSYFIPDENIQTYLICLQSCNMQKHQKANFRPAEYVCV